MPFSLASNGASVQDFSREIPVTQGFHLGALACSNGLDFKRLLPFVGMKVGLNGETLQTAQRAAAHLSTITLAGRYEKTGLKRNRKYLERFESG